MAARETFISVQDMEVVLLHRKRQSYSPCGHPLIITILLDDYLGSSSSNLPNLLADEDVVTKVMLQTNGLEYYTRNYQTKHAMDPGVFVNETDANLIEITPTSCLYLPFGRLSRQIPQHARETPYRMQNQLYSKRNHS
jgi:hypothetical protein